MPLHAAALSRRGTSGSVPLAPQAAAACSLRAGCEAALQGPLSGHQRRTSLHSGAAGGLHVSRGNGAWHNRIPAFAETHKARVVGVGCSTSAPASGPPDCSRCWLSFVMGRADTGAPVQLGTKMCLQKGASAGKWVTQAALKHSLACPAAENVVDAANAAGPNC